MKVKISGNYTVFRGKEQVSCDLGGESAILDFKRGIYYGLNETGTRIWNLINEPKTINEVRDTILKEYDVQPERCDLELSELLQELLAKGLIEIKDEEAS